MGNFSKNQHFPEENQRSNCKWKKEQKQIIALTLVFMPRALGLVVFSGPDTEQNSWADQPPLDSRSSVWASSPKGTFFLPSQHCQSMGLLPTGAVWEWTELRAFQANFARPKDRKSQKRKMRVRNKTLSFLRMASHFLWAVNNHN